MHYQIFSLLSHLPETAICFASVRGVISRRSPDLSQPIAQPCGNRRRYNKVVFVQSNDLDIILDRFYIGDASQTGKGLRMVRIADIAARRGKSEVQLVAELLDRLKTLEAVSQELGITVSGLCKWLKRNGFSREVTVTWRLTEKD